MLHHCGQMCQVCLLSESKTILTWPSLSILNALTVATKLLVMQLEVLLEALKIDYEVANLQNIELQKKLDAFMRDRRRTTDTLELVTSDKKKALETTKAFKCRVYILFT